MEKMLIFLILKISHRVRPDTKSQRLKVVDLGEMNNFHYGIATQILKTVEILEKDKKFKCETCAWIRGGGERVGDLCVRNPASLYLDNLCSIHQFCFLRGRIMLVDNKYYFYCR
jgi:hypothetical protein